MNWARLILSGVRFHWRAHLGTVLGVAIGTSVIVGALLVSDSLKGTLLDQAESRVGFARAALFSGEKLFRSALAAELGADCAPALLLEGSASRGDGSALIRCKCWGSIADSGGWRSNRIVVS
jgi:hypothetical protein